VTGPMLAPSGSTANHGRGFTPCGGWTASYVRVRVAPYGGGVPDIAGSCPMGRGVAPYGGVPLYMAVFGPHGAVFGIHTQGCV